MYTFLSNDWAGLVIALAVAALGALLFFPGRRARSTLVRLPLLGLGGLILLLGIVLTFTSAWHGISVARMWANNPAPGVMIDVGGYRMHMLAEGENKGNPTIVWVPGGHSNGYNFYNFHRIFREETRSILFDRPSSGWSDVGPYPRTTAREIEEFNRMIEASGEQGPFLLVGHSYGGLFSSQFAQHHPDKIAGLVLLDSGNPINWRNPDAAGFMKRFSQATFYDGLLMSLGIPYSMQAAAGGQALDDLMAHYARTLGDVWPQIGELNKAAMNVYGTSSIFAESSTEEFFEKGETIAGALNGKPLIYITFLGSLNLDSEAAREGARVITGQDGVYLDQQLQGLKRNRADMKKISDRFQSISVPDGASHNFPYERPEFVEEQVRRTLSLLRNGSTTSSYTRD